MEMQLPCPKCRVAMISGTQTKGGRPGSHLVEHIRKQTSNLAGPAKGANDNFTATS